MKIYIEALSGDWIIVPLSDVEACYPDDDVIYFRWGVGFIACRLSSAVAV